MTDATPDSTEQIEFGSHSMLIDHANRTVEVHSDMDAGHRAAQADWRKVVRKLDELGCADLDELGADRGVVIFRGTF